MGPPGKYQRQEKAFDFFSRRAVDKASFTIEDIAAYCGWDVSTPKTYLTKKWKDFLVAAGDGSYTVKPEFSRVSKTQFLGHASQKDLIYTEHARVRHDHVVTFEFLIPRICEDAIREGLDELFFADGLERRIRELGLERMEAICPRDPDRSPQSYVGDLLARANRFSGYTVVRAERRFREPQLLSRAEAARLYAIRGRYVVDQPAVAVMFTIPCQTGSHTFAYGSALSTDIHEGLSFEPADLEREVREIRGLFFALVVEAVVRTVGPGEEVCLFETGYANRLYRWQVR